MDINEVKAFLETNKETEEVKSFINGYKVVDLESVKKLVTTAGNNEVKSWFDSEIGTRATKGIETFKAKELDKLINEEVDKRTGKNETPEMKRIRELEEKLASKEKSEVRQEMLNKARKIVDDKKLPLDILDLINLESDDLINTNISKFEKMFNSYIAKAVEETVKTNSYKPTGKETKNTKQITKEDIENMTVIQRTQFKNADPELYKKLTGK